MSAITAKASRKMKKYAVLTREPRCFLGSFDFSWEQRKLGDIGKARSGVGFPDADQGGLTGVPFFKVSDMNSDGNENEMTVANNYVTTEQIADHRWSPITDLPAIFFAKVGAAVMLNRKRLCRFPFLLDNNTMAYSLSPTKWDADFAKALFGTVDLTSLVQVGALPSYNAGDVESMEIYLPSLLEQEQIGAYFKHLDNLITLHQRKCALLFSPFQALISMMFTTSTFSWEQRKLGEVSESYSGGTPSVGVKEYYGGKIPFIRSAEINSEITELFLTEEGLKNSSARLVGVGDILYALYGATSGEVGRARLKGAINQAILAIKPHTGYDSGYLAQWLRKSKHSIIETYLQGGQGNLSGTIVKELSVDFPLLKEQQAIGDFFSRLDNLITLHQRQPFLHSTPEISLTLQLIHPFYTSSWEQRKFSDITFLAGEKNRDNLPLESYSITNEHGFVPQDEKFENGGTMREADKRMYYIVSPNSFAYNPARINVGSIGYQNVGKNVIVSSLYEVFKTSEDVDDRLLWHWFKSPDFQKLIMQLQEGGVRLYFYYDKLCMGEVSLPSLEEQRKIGKLFDTLDNLITLHQRKGKAAVTGCSNDANNSKGVYCKARDFGSKCYKKSNPNRFDA